jgi:hypothetical protein
MELANPVVPHAAFVDFVLSVGEARLRAVRSARAGGLGYDFYEAIRAAIVDMHSRGRPVVALDQFLASLTDERRKLVYPTLVEGYRAFLGRHRVTWFTPPRGSALPSIEVDVTPDLALVVDGVPHLLRGYWAANPLTKRRVAVEVELMGAGLSAMVPGATLAVLDVRRGTLHTAKRNPRLGLVLRGDGAAFATIAGAL